MLIAFNKPYGVLSQFTVEVPGQRTLAEFGFPEDVYPIGRLDADSEGLLLLSDESDLNQRLLHPRHAHEREYWAQVERIPTRAALEKLGHGVVIQSRRTLPCRAWILDPQPEEMGRVTLCAKADEYVPNCGEPGVMRPAILPRIPPRDPPIRFRRNVPACWIGLELVEGKNRQVRRMTAAVGHPTLRLIRTRIGRFWLHNLPSSKWRVITPEEFKLVTQ